MVRTVQHYAFGLLALLMSSQVIAATTETQEIFKRYQNRIVQIRILEASSGSRTSLGSGFVATPTGLIVTNYHVMSELVHKPEQFRAEAVRDDGTSVPLVLLNFDVIHDLAIVGTEVKQADYFDLETASIQKGTRVYSIGTPLDLGFTIVEGTYNGLLETSLYEKIHFTGSINPGMSGGPAILEDGRVVGVNVASAGNQVSFLVPAKFVKKLLQDTLASSKPAPGTMLNKLRDQLYANQNVYMSKLLASPLVTTPVQQFRLPGKFAPYLKCWGNANRVPENLYESLSQICSSEDDLYISQSHSSGMMYIRHDLISSDKLNRFRFFSLYQKYFDGNYQDIHASKEDVTKFKCESDFVEHHGITFKTALCLRAYKKLPGLYDAVLRAATLNNDHRGVQTTLVLAGVSYDNAARFARKYMDSVTWNK